MVGVAASRPNGIVFLGQLSSLTIKGGVGNTKRMSAQSKNIHELALDYINQGVVIYDKNLIVIGFNRRVLDILDMPADQFAVGDNFAKWVRYNADHGSYGGQGTAEQRAEERLAIARTFKPYRSENPRPNNRIVEINGKLVPGIGYITTYTDITEQAQSYKLLKESEQRFKDFAEMGSDWFWEMGPDLRFTYHSPRYFEITGFRPEDKIGTVRTQFVDKDSLASEQEKWAAHMADLDARRPFKGFEYEFKAQTGQVIRARISGTPILDSEGTFMGYRGIGTDITEIMRNAAALRESEELFRALIDNLPSLINLKDKDGRYLIINRKHSELFGFQQQSIVGKVISEFLSEKQADDALLQETEVIETKSAVTRERVIQTSDHGSREFLVTKFPILDERGEVARMGTIGTEITQLKEAQAALLVAKQEAEKARADAEAANRGKSDFLAAMSHDLRTPLNAIIGFADAISLQYFGPISEKYQEYSHDIRWSGEHLLSLIGDILDVTAIENGMLAINKEECEIAGVVEECIKIIQGQARSLGIVIVSNVNEGTPSFFADRQAMKKIVINLLANALKFTPNGGSVTIEAEATDASRVIQISDTGIGIPCDQLATVTDPFVKVATNPYTTQDGAGLGLAIVKSLVNSHGGRLDIQSDIGKGTTVRITLPHPVT